MSNAAQGQPSGLLISGGAGFIGSSFIERALTRWPGVRIICVDSFFPFYPAAWKERYWADATRSAQKGQVELIRADLADLSCDPHSHPQGLLAQLKRLGVGGAGWLSVHFAAMAGVRPSVADPSLYARANVLGTLHWLELSRILGIERVINTSSSSVYGRKSVVPFTETTNLTAPQSPYAASKLAAEAFCANAATLHGMRVASLRLFTVYGPKQRPDLAIHKFLSAMRKSQPITVYGDGETARDYTFIDDILEGYFSALQWLGSAREPAHETFNLGSHRPVKLSELLSLIQELSGLEAKIERAPIPSEDVLITYADLSKSQKILGYQPKTPLREGLMKFVEWHRNWNPQ